MNTSPKGPYRMSRAGKFQISVFKTPCIVPDEDDPSQTHITESRSLCIQFSQFSGGKWHQQEIRCPGENLRDLNTALDLLNRSIRDMRSTRQYFSPFSYLAHGKRSPRR